MAKEFVYFERLFENNLKYYRLIGYDGKSAKKLALAYDRFYFNNAAPPAANQLQELSGVSVKRLLEANRVYNQFYAWSKDLGKAMAALKEYCALPRKPSFARLHILREKFGLQVRPNEELLNRERRMAGAQASLAYLAENLLKKGEETIPAGRRKGMQAALAPFLSAQQRTHILLNGDSADQVYLMAKEAGLFSGKRHRLFVKRYEEYRKYLMELGAIGHEVNLHSVRQFMAELRGKTLLQKLHELRKASRQLEQINSLRKTYETLFFSGVAEEKRKGQIALVDLESEIGFLTDRIRGKLSRAVPDTRARTAALLKDAMKKNTDRNEQRILQDHYLALLNKPLIKRRLPRKR